MSKSLDKMSFIFLLILLIVHLSFCDGTCSCGSLNSNYYFGACAEQCYLGRSFSGEKQICPEDCLAEINGPYLLEHPDLTERGLEELQSEQQNGTLIIPLQLRIIPALLTLNFTNKAFCDWHISNAPLRKCSEKVYKFEEGPSCGDNGTKGTFLLSEKRQNLTIPLSKIKGDLIICLSCTGGQSGELRWRAGFFSNHTRYSKKIPQQPLHASYSVRRISETHARIEVRWERPEDCEPLPSEFVVTCSIEDAVIFQQTLPYFGGPFRVSTFASTEEYEKIQCSVAWKASGRNVAWVRGNATLAPEPTALFLKDETGTSVRFTPDGWEAITRNELEASSRAFYISSPVSMFKKFAVDPLGGRWFGNGLDRPRTIFLMPFRLEYESDGSTPADSSLMRSCNDRPHLRGWKGEDEMFIYQELEEDMGSIVFQSHISRLCWTQNNGHHGYDIHYVPVYRRLYDNMRIRPRKLETNCRIVSPALASSLDGHLIVLTPEGLSELENGTCTLRVPLEHPEEIVDLLFDEDNNHLVFIEKNGTLSELRNGNFFSITRVDMPVECDIGPRYDFPSSTAQIYDSVRMDSVSQLLPLNTLPPFAAGPPVECLVPSDVEIQKSDKSWYFFSFLWAEHCRNSKPGLRINFSISNQSGFVKNGSGQNFTFASNHSFHVDIRVLPKFLYWELYFPKDRPKVFRKLIKPNPDLSSSGIHLTAVVLPPLLVLLFCVAFVAGLFLHRRLKLWSILISPRDITITQGRKVGKGTFSAAYEAMWGEKRVCLLFPLLTHKNGSAYSDTEKAAAEKNILQAGLIQREFFKCPFIVKIYGICQNMRIPGGGGKETCCLVMELMEEEKRANEVLNALTEIDMINVAISVAKGMGRIHARGYIHRDLARRNVLVGRRGGFKVSDFGLARAASFLFPYISSHVQCKAIPRNSIPPEAFGAGPHYEGKFSPASDVWSFGTFLFELFTKQDAFATVFRELGPEAAMRRIQEHVCSLRRTVLDPVRGLAVNEDTFSLIPADIQDLMRKCFEFDPKNRPVFHNGTEEDIVSLLDQIKKRILMRQNSNSQVDDVELEMIPRVDVYQKDHAGEGFSEQNNGENCYVQPLIEYI